MEKDDSYPRWTEAELELRGILEPLLTRSPLLRCYESIGSTMDGAEALAGELHTGQLGVVLSRRQLQGRGRQGRVWEGATDAFFCTLC